MLKPMQLRGSLKTVVLGFVFIHSVHMQHCTSVALWLFLQLVALLRKSSSSVTLYSPVMSLDLVIVVWSMTSVLW